MTSDTAKNMPDQPRAAYRYGAALPASSVVLKEFLKGTEIHELFESYYCLIRIPVAIIDLEANVLFSSRWQRLCTQFHRTNPESCARCIENDRSIATQLVAGESYAVLRCANGLTDCASPIVVDGVHVANVFVGQFLTREPDEAWFVQQAQKFGFDVSDYLSALREVPVVDETRAAAILDLLARMTRVITNLSVGRKRALELQTRQSVILDTIPQGVFWKGLDGRYLGCNARFAQTAGLTAPDQVIGKSDYDLPWPRREADAYRADDRTVIETRQPLLHKVEPLQSADGSRKTVDTSKMPLLDAAGSPCGVLGIYDDLTQQLAAQERFRAAFMTGLDAVYIATLEQGRIIEVNDEFLRMFGYEREQLVGSTARELELYDGPSDWNEIVAALETEGFVRDVEVWARKRNGERFLVSASIRTMDSSEEPQLLGVLRDVSARESARREKELLEAQLRQSQKMEAIGRLAGGVAHDFNNLLSVILNYTGFVFDSLHDADPVRSDLLEIKHSAERATALTRQLLAFSRMQVLQPVPLDLNRISADLDKMLRRILGEDVELLLERAPDVWLTLADPSQIEQVLMNLVVNARDAMPNGGRLSITTSNVEIRPEECSQGSGMKPGCFVQLSVADTGCGMDEPTLARIFEPFFTTKEKGKGTGLGLSTVHGIVNQSGGQILVRSKRGEGTTFRVYLPRYEGPYLTLPRSMLDPNATRGTETILVVEDEPAVREASRRVLAGAGYSVLVAANGREALGVWATHANEIALVITDVIMPQMGGRDLATCLCRDRPELKVLYMSGYTDDAVHAHTGLVAPSAFLSKPCSAEDLRRKVREVLDQCKPEAHRPKAQVDAAHDLPVQVDEALPILVQANRPIGH